jgi:hypothetical protein
MGGKARSHDPYRERDAQGARLKRLLALATVARHHAETTRLTRQLKRLGIPA